MTVNSSGNSKYYRYPIGILVQRVVIHLFHVPATYCNNSQDFSALTKFISHFHIWLSSRTADKQFSLINGSYFLCRKAQYAYELEQLFQGVPCIPFLHYSFSVSPGSCCIFPILEHKEAPTLKIQDTPLFSQYKNARFIFYIR